MHSPEKKLCINARGEIIVTTPLTLLALEDSFLYTYQVIYVDSGEDSDESIFDVDEIARTA